MITDNGFFTTLQRIYDLGLIKPSRQAALALFERASKQLLQAKSTMLLIVASLCYNTIMGSAQALLLTKGINTHPSQVYEEIVKEFVNTGVLEIEKAEWIRQSYELRKKVDKGRLVQISSREADEWIKRAKEFAEKTWQYSQKSRIKGRAPE